MAIFGSDWLDGYDSMAEYETHVGGSKEYTRYEDGNPIIRPVHLDAEYDSIENHEHGIKHFRDE